FLKEAEDIVPGLRGLGLPARMDHIGNKWSGIGAVLKNISEKERPDEGLLRDASAKADELWALELDFYKTVIEKV
ncbi:MAG: hypothetical protein ACREOP_04695, partial [Thermodesulfobacteriota bacterium]